MGGGGQHSPSADPRAVRGGPLPRAVTTACGRGANGKGGIAVLCIVCARGCLVLHRWPRGAGRGRAGRGGGNAQPCVPCRHLWGQSHCGSAPGETCGHVPSAAVLCKAPFSPQTCTPQRCPSCCPCPPSLPFPRTHGTSSAGSRHGQLSAQAALTVPVFPQETPVLAGPAQSVPRSPLGWGHPPGCSSDPQPWDPALPGAGWGGSRRRHCCRRTGRARGGCSVLAVATGSFPLAWGRREGGLGRQRKPGSSEPAPCQEIPPCRWPPPRSGCSPGQADGGTRPWVGSGCPAQLQHTPGNDAPPAFPRERPARLCPHPGASWSPRCGEQSAPAPRRCGPALPRAAMAAAAVAGRGSGCRGHEGSTALKRRAAAASATRSRSAPSLLQPDGSTSLASTDHPQAGSSAPVHRYAVSSPRTLIVKRTNCPLRITVRSASLGVGACSGGQSTAGAPVPACHQHPVHYCQLEPSLGSRTLFGTGDLTATSAHVQRLGSSLEMQINPEVTQKADDGVSLPAMQLSLLRQLLWMWLPLIYFSCAGQIVSAHVSSRSREPGAGDTVRASCIAAACIPWPSQGHQHPSALLGSCRGAGSMPRSQHARALQPPARCGRTVPGSCRVPAG